MGLFGGSGGTKEGTQTTEPWSHAVPHLDQIMGTAQTYQNQGVGGQVYGGPTLAPMDPNTSMGLQRVQSTALNSDTSLPYQAGNQLIQSGGMTGGMTPGLNTLMANATGGNGLTTGARFGNVADRAQINNADVIGGLSNIALGQGAPSSQALQGLYNSQQGQNFNPNWYLDNISSGGKSINTEGLYRDVQRNAMNPTATDQVDRGQYMATANAATGPTAAEARYANGGPLASEQFDRGQYSATANAATGPTYSESGLQGLRYGTLGIGTGGAYGQAANDFSGPTAADQFLGSMATGGDTNQYAARQADINAKRIADQVASMQSGAGRYGGFAHAAQLADRISEANNPMMMQAFEADQARRLAATGQMDQARQGYGGLRLGAIGGQTGVEGQNIGNMMGANAQMDQSRQAANATRLAALGGELGAMGQADQMRLGATGQQDASRAAANATRLQALGGNLAALGQQDAARNAASNTALSAIGGETGVYNQNIANQMAAAQAAANSRRADTATSAGLLGSIADADSAAIQNRINAANSVAGLNNQNLQTELSALGGQTGVQNQNIANTTNAAQGLIGAYGQGLDRSAQWASMAPTLNNLQYDPAQRLGQVGDYLQNRSQQELNDERMRFEQEQQAPWNQLNRYLGAVSGLGGIIQGSGTTNSYQTQTAPWFGEKQGMFGGLSDAAGAVMPLLKMLPGGSDEKAKTDIQKYGTDPDTGLPLYAYRYKGDPKSYPKVVGPMAQDIAKVDPDGVKKMGGGLLAVDMKYMKPRSAGLLGAM